MPRVNKHINIMEIHTFPKKAAETKIFKIVVTLSCVPRDELPDV